MTDTNESSNDPSVQSGPSNTQQLGIDPTQSEIKSTTDTPFLHGGIPKKRKNTIVQLFTITLILAGTIAALFSINSSQDTRSKAVDNGPVLSLSPSTKLAVINDTFNIGITLNTGTDKVSATTIHILYDPTSVEILSFTHGTQLPVILVPETHANGNLAVTLGSQPTTPFQGVGIIGTIRVKVITVKQSSIAFTSATKVSSVGKTGNTLASTKGTTITTTTNTPILTHTQMPTQAVTRTPTPSRIATRTPTPSRVVTSTPKVVTPIQTGTCSVAPGATCGDSSKAGCTSASAIHNKGWCLEYGSSCCLWTPD